MFLRPLKKESIKSIADLNARFRTWLESEYHRSPHRGLEGGTPLEAWIAKAKHIITIDPTVDLDDVFFHEINRKVHKDSTITVNGTLYEVPSILIGCTVKLRFDPRDPHSPILVCCDGIEYGEARIVDAYANTRVSRAHPDRDHLDQNAGIELPNVVATLQAARFQTGEMR